MGVNMTRLSTQTRERFRALSHGLALSCGIARFAARNRIDGVVSLTLHSFTSTEHVGFFGEQPIRPLIEFLRAMQSLYAVCTLPEAHAYLQGERSPVDRPSLVLTIDDGYADNFELLVPALASLGIPATFFVTTSFIDEGRPPWPVEIAAILRSAATKELNWPERCPIGSDREKKQAAARIKRLWRPLPATERNQKLDELRLHVGAKRVVTPRPMTWEQIRAMKNAGHTIASHTHWHGILTDLPDEEVRLELSSSKARLEKELNSPCEFFAYPNGDADARTVQLVAACGYVGAFTQVPGISQRGENALLRPRINLPPYENAASLSFRTAMAA